MWDDIIIGNGTKGTSACKVFDIEGDHSISQNKVSFWISDCFLGTGMTIFKDTVEGQTLENMIKNKVGLTRIDKWIDELVIKKMKPKDLINRIKQSNVEYFESGKEAKSKEILKVLGLS